MRVEFKIVKHYCWFLQLLFTSHKLTLHCPLAGYPYHTIYPGGYSHFVCMTYFEELEEKETLTFQLIYSNLVRL